MVQIIKDSQFYTSLEQIKWAVERLKNDTDFYDDEKDKLHENFNYVIKGIENTNKRYKLQER